MQSGSRSREVKRQSDWREILSGYKRRAHVSSLSHIRRSWFEGCQSLLYHRSERATKRSPCTDGRLRTDEHYAQGMRAQRVSSSKTLESNELNYPHLLNVRTRIALCR